MNLSTQRWCGLSRAGFTLTIMITLLLSGATMGVLAEPEDPPTTLLNEQTTLATASLHNAGFDNHDWYFFKDRYDPTYPNGPDGQQPLLPDADNNRPDVIPAASLQDWRLWYMRGTPLIQTFEENSLVQSGQSVAVRTYDGDIHQGGLYQIIYNTIPGVVYEFKIYAQARPQSGDTLVGLRVGIAPDGWAPNSKVDPAVGSFPSNMVWGTAKNTTNTWVELSVQAQATANHITVFAFADARGGRSHAIVWDTASFRAVNTVVNPTDRATLHNPSFDNHDWYFFGADRYLGYPDGPNSSGKPIVPDDDNNVSNNIPLNIRQDWRIWYMRNTPLIQSFVENTIKVSGESVAMRTFDGNIHQAGLYQMIYTTTPCLTYNFQMYGLSKPDSSIGSPAAELKVGIDVVGWHPNTESSPSDPAVPGAFPITTIWGPSHDYKGNFGVLTVTAEARANKLAVYSYAYTTGGRAHAIVWDSGSFADVTPATLLEPTAPPAASGISNPTVVTASTGVTLTWTTPNSAIDQVFYHLLYCGEVTTPVTPTESMTYTVYLPAVSRMTPWLYTTLNKTATANHTVKLTGLSPNCTYEYILASRGVAGDSCVLWSSDKLTFKTAP